MGEHGEWAVRAGVVLLLQPGRSERADGLVVFEIFGQNVLGGLDVRVENGFFGFGVGKPFKFGGTRSQFEQGDSVGEIDGSRTAFLQVVKPALDVGYCLLRGRGSW